MFFFIYITFLVAYLIANFFLGDAYWWLALLNSFKYWLFIPVFIFWIEAIWEGAGRFKSLLLLSLSGLWLYLYIWFPFYTIQGNAEKINGKTSKIMTFNLLYKNDNLKAIAKTIKEEDPDVIAFQETNKDFIKKLDSNLPQIYKYRSYDPKHIIGVATYSKYPIQQEYRIRTTHGYAEFVSVKKPQNNFALVNMHTPSIDPLNVFGGTDKILKGYKNRDLMLEEVLNFLSGNKVPLSRTIIVGDFNSTEGNDVYKALHKVGFKDSYRQVNPVIPFYSFSFPNNVKDLLNRDADCWPFLRLDYIFTGSRIRTLKSKVVKTNTGSDHSPVISEIGFI